MPLLGRRAAEPVDVLVVCTGNICRSPYLAARLRAGLPGLRIASAGTAALVGRAPTDEILALLDARGIDAGSATARRLDRSLVRGAELILTAERRHRLEAVRLDPSAAARTFAVKEFVRLVADLPDAAGPAAVLAHVAAAVTDSGDRDHDDDLADPYGREESAYERMAEEADELVAAIVRVMQ